MEKVSSSIFGACEHGLFESEQDEIQKHKWQILSDQKVQFPGKSGG